MILIAQKYYTPIVVSCYPVTVNTPSVGGNMTPQLVLTKGEIPEEGRKKEKKMKINKI